MAELRRIAPAAVSGSGVRRRIHLLVAVLDGEHGAGTMRRVGLFGGDCPPLASETGHQPGEFTPGGRILTQDGRQLPDQQANRASRTSSGSGASRTSWALCSSRAATAICRPPARSGDQYNVRIGGDATGPVVVGGDNQVEVTNPAPPKTDGASTPAADPGQHNIARDHGTLYSGQHGELHIHHHEDSGASSGS